VVLSSLTGYSSSDSYPSVEIETLGYYLPSLRTVQNGRAQILVVLGILPARFFPEVDPFGQARQCIDFYFKKSNLQS